MLNFGGVVFSYQHGISEYVESLSLFWCITYVVTYPFNFISCEKPYVHGKLLGSITGTFIVIFRRWLEFLLAFYPLYNWVSQLASIRNFHLCLYFGVSPGSEFIPFFFRKDYYFGWEVSDTNNHVTGKYSCITFLYWVSVGLFWIAREEENLLKGLDFLWIPAHSVSKTQFRETTHPISCLVGENITKLISNARIDTFRIDTFFQKNPNGSKVRKSDILSIFEQNMLRVYDVFRGGCGYVTHCDLSSSFTTDW